MSIPPNDPLPSYELLADPEWNASNLSCHDVSWLIGFKGVSDQRLAKIEPWPVNDGNTVTRFSRRDAIQECTNNKKPSFSSWRRSYTLLGQQVASAKEFIRAALLPQVDIIRVDHRQMDRLRPAELRVAIRGKKLVEFEISDMLTAKSSIRLRKYRRSLRYAAQMQVPLIFSSADRKIAMTNREKSDLLLNVGVPTDKVYSSVRFLLHRLRRNSARLSNDFICPGVTIGNEVIR